MDHRCCLPRTWGFYCSQHGCSLWWMTSLGCRGAAATWTRRWWRKELAKLYSLSHWSNSRPSCSRGSTDSPALAMIVPTCRKPLRSGGEEPSPVHGLLLKKTSASNLHFRPPSISEQIWGSFFSGKVNTASLEAGQYINERWHISKEDSLDDCEWESELAHNKLLNTKHSDFLRHMHVRELMVAADFELLFQVLGYLDSERWGRNQLNMTSEGGKIFNVKGVGFVVRWQVLEHCESWRLILNSAGISVSVYETRLGYSNQVTER